MSLLIGVGNFGQDALGRLYGSNLDPETQTIIVNNKIGQLIGKPFNEILNMLDLTPSQALDILLVQGESVPTNPTDPTNNKFPYTFPFTL